MKPNSLRNVLNQIKNIYLQNPSHAEEELLTIIAKNYGIKKAALFAKNEKSFSLSYSYYFTGSLNEDSRVLEDALNTKSPSYLSKFEDIKKDYLAVLPAYDASDKLNSIMVIEDMQFLHFNKDTIFSVWVILNYFSDFKSQADYSSDLIKKYPHCPSDFLVEIKRLSHIKKKLGIKSLILVVKINKSGVETEDINSFISKNLRGMDMSCYKENMIFILFPLVSYSNIQPVIEKIEAQISARFSFSQGDFSYKVLDILDNPFKTADYILSLIKNESA